MDELIAIRSPQALRELWRARNKTMSLSDARKLTAHLKSLGPAESQLRIAFVRTYTSEMLDPWLDLHGAMDGFDVHTYHAPFGLNVMEAEAGSGLTAYAPAMTVLLLTRTELHQALTQSGNRSIALDTDQLEHEITDRLRDLLQRFRRAVDGHIILTILPSFTPPGLGLFDAQATTSQAAWWARTKAAIATVIRNELQATLFLDLDEMVSELGRERIFDMRFWYVSRFPFTSSGAFELAGRLVKLAAARRSPKAKVIALDADNTLWGGVVGEEGPTGIALGPEYPGNAFVDFQRRLLDYQDRGFILALCSKNNPEDVEEILERHPHQLLRNEHFAAKRVNWQAKTDNLRALAEELNLGLDSFVFVDDSNHECALIRRELPMVEVIQTPSKSAKVPACLEKVARLEILSLTQEDLEKTALYSQERRRRELKSNFDAQGTDIRGYLESLEMRMNICINDSTRLPRLSQLTQKTNQFNLTTRRYDERQIRDFIDSEHWLVGHFSLADVFGDSGVVGLAILKRISNIELELDTFLMSCRVIGRQAESAFFSALCRLVASEGVTGLVADYIPTRKNRLVEGFLPEHGFLLQSDGRYQRSFDVNPPEAEDCYPISVFLEQH